MTTRYEEFHRIIDRLISEDLIDDVPLLPSGDGLQFDAAVRAAFIRVIREELTPGSLDKS